MTPFLALLRKHLHESRGFLLLTGSALFGLGWLFVFVTSLNETRILKDLGENSQSQRIQMLRNLGLDELPSSAAIIMTFWNHPFILILISAWCIARGSAAVAAEVERGTLDMVLSRPVSRSVYLFSHVLIGIAGIYFLAFMLMLGATIAVSFNYLRVPFSFWDLRGPALNLAALGLPIYGYTLLASTLDQVRWRPTMIGSVITLAAFISWVIAHIPVLKGYAWRDWVELWSIFSLYNPVDAVTNQTSLYQDVGILALVCLICVGTAFALFVRRDLPANA